MGRGGSDGGRDTGLERYSSEVESKLQRFQKRHFSRNLLLLARTQGLRGPALSGGGGGDSGTCHLLATEAKAALR